MRNNSDLKVLGYIVMVTAVPAVVLAAMFTFLKPIHDTNEAIYNKKQILSSLNAPLEINAEKLSDEEINKYFENVEQLVMSANGEMLDAYEQKAEEIQLEKEEKKPEADRVYPIFVYNNNGKEYHILSVRGNGLWDKIWGWIAIEDDGKTVVGAAFGHKAETPGLGAEISDNKGWKSQFIGKKVYDDNGDFTSVDVVKGVIPADKKPYAVDGISGATVTGDGVAEMLKSGIKIYEPYLQTIK